MSTQYTETIDLTQQTVQSVSQLTRSIKDLLEPAFSSVCVQGEISNFKAQASGHLYFSLKDADAQLSAVMFRSSVRGLERLPRDGDQVIAYGELSIYAPRGNYQLVVRSLKQAGVGALLLKLHQLKEKLERMGYFDPRHKKPLPRFPKRIGVVTSPTGAVIRDICNVLRRRYSGFRLILNPVKVQGEGAAQEIAQAIEQFNSHDLADVLIVGRGGGSIEDLWAFNEEPVVEAIFRSRIPIISAVGHETDTTLADFAADVRAPTPSAAAELVAAETGQLLGFLTQTRRRMEQALRQQLGQARQRLAQLRRHPILSSPYGLLGQRIQRLGGLQQTLDALKPGAQLQQKRLICLRLQKSLDQALRVAIGRQHDRLTAMARLLTGINPTQLLSKGYAILFSQKDGGAIVSARSLEPGSHVRARLCDGEADLVVEDVRAKL